MPSKHNVKGRVDQLYSGFDKIDDIWIDPSNDLSQQLYLVSNDDKHGLRVVCQEFDEPFINDSSFCHLPVDQLWRSALKDLDRTKPIDAVTWRNRTKNFDGGFWVFFQGKNMITIDPYEMKLRFTYDIQKWMKLNESLTAAFYDYHKSVYHLFMDNNKYYTWTVNVPYMNKLPMTWDRAFLHGTLSKEMKINKDFFHFDSKDIIDYPQPYLVNIYNEEQIHDNRIEQDDDTSKSNSISDKTIDLQEPTITKEELPPLDYVTIATNKEQIFIIKKNDKSILKDQNRPNPNYEDPIETNDIDYKEQMKSNHVMDFISEISEASSSSSLLHWHLNYFIRIQLILIFFIILIY